MKCKACGQEIGMIQAPFHMMGMHGSADKLKCKACGRSFVSQGELTSHQQKAHM